MIIAEKRLKELFETLPTITDIDGIARQPKIDVGSEEDCLVFLNQNRKAGSSSYPLVWIETPLTVKGIRRIDLKPKLILATLSNSKISNSERIRISFETMLFPLLGDCITALNVSGFTKLMNRDNEGRTNHFNYGANHESVMPDIWDAIKFECEIEMDDCPQRTINY